MHESPRDEIPGSSPLLRCEPGETGESVNTRHVAHGAMIEPLDPQIRAALALTARSGGHALLLGAGVSISSGVPSAWHVLQDLIRKVAATQHAVELEDPEEWWKNTFGLEPAYSTVLEQLANTRAERRALLESYFVPSSDETLDERAPIAAHRSIARLMGAGRIRIVLTTNFDRLLEQALSEVGVEPVIVSTEDDAASLEPLHAQRAVVVHMNGDYLEPVLSNTEEELADYPEALNALISQVFAEYGLIIAGWSAKWDRGLIDLLERAPDPVYASWWIEPTELNATQRRLARSRAAEHIERGADDAFGDLADMCEALEEQRTRSDPLTLAAAVGAAKRDLAGVGPAIRTHDRLLASLERLEDSAAINPDGYHGDATERDHRERTLLADGEVAFGLIAALAYWGNADTDRWWFDSIERFAHRPHVDGSSGLIGLTRSPSTIIIYTAGVAAAAASRWDLVRRLLTEPSTETPGGSDIQPVALALPPDSIGLSDGVRTIYSFLWDPIRVALGWNRGTYVDAWERFEYLHHLLWIGTHHGTGHLGWTPHIRVSGLGPNESLPVPDLWLDRICNDVAFVQQMGGSLPLTEGLQEARLTAAVAFARHTSSLDDRLLSPTSGALPSGRHYPGRFDDDPSPSAIRRP